VEDAQEDDVTILPTGVDVHSQRRYDWQTTVKRGDESLASTAHTGHVFQRKKKHCQINMMVAENEKYSMNLCNTFRTLKS